jgi:hypothetical protein
MHEGVFRISLNYRAYSVSNYNSFIWIQEVCYTVKMGRLASESVLFVGDVGNRH